MNLLKSEIHAIKYALAKGAPRYGAECETLKRMEYLDEPTLAPPQRLTVSVKIVVA
jgi:hypothetical protein